MSVIWGKSSLSSSNGNCVEVARRPGGTLGVRNSSNPERSVLRFTPEEWRAFLSGVRLGGFNSFGRTASSVGVGLAHDVASLRDDPRALYRGRPSDAILRAAEPEATCPLSVLCIGQKEHGDTFCAYRVPSDITSSLDYSREVSRLFLIGSRPSSAVACSWGTKLPGPLKPGKNRQMFNPRHVESGDA
jgi:hypothetical protein